MIAEFNARISHLVDEVQQTPTVAGVQQVMLPGEREWEHRKRALQDGLRLPEDVLAKLRGAAELVGSRPEWL